MTTANSIDLQILHDGTQRPFMIPYKKAKDCTALRDYIVKHTKSDDDIKITLYSHDMKVIDWDDWEDIIEPSGSYNADVNDSWIKTSKTGTIEKDIANSQPSNVPRPRSIAVKSPTSSQAVSPDPYQHQSGEFFRQNAQNSNKTPQNNPLVDIIRKSIESNNVQQNVRKSRLRYHANDEDSDEETPPWGKKTGARIPPPPSLAVGTYVSSDTANPNAFNMSGLSSSLENEMGFVKGNESFGEIQQKLLQGSYGKRPQRNVDLTPKSDRELMSITQAARTQGGKPKPGFKIIVVNSSVLDPEAPIAAKKKYPIEVIEAMTTKRFVEILEKSPEYTNLLVLEPLGDNKYQPIETITPGSAMSTVPFKDLGWRPGVHLSWEHIENPVEAERRNTSLPWE